MTSTTPLVAPQPAATSATPSSADAVTVRLPRRVAVVAAGFVACALPLSFLVSAAVMLLTGTEADHRFHQVTGQGLLSCSLWLAGLLPLLVAGLRGQRPSTRTGLHLLAFLAATAVAGALAPEAGAWTVTLYALVTGGLLWAAVPLRPRLRGAFTAGLDPVLLPVALLMAALVTPFALGEADLQQAMADEHATMAHYFDMAWVALVLVALAAVAALSVPARRLAVLGTGGLVLVGTARAAFTSEVGWSAAAVALGAAGLAVAVLRSRTGRSSRTAV